MTYYDLAFLLAFAGMLYWGEAMDCANCITPVSDGSTMVCNGDGGFGQSKIKGMPACHAVEGGIK